MTAKGCNAAWRVCSGCFWVQRLPLSTAQVFKGLLSAVAYGRYVSLITTELRLQLARGHATTKYALGKAEGDILVQPDHMICPAAAWPCKMLSLITLCALCHLSFGYRQCAAYPIPWSRVITAIQTFWIQTELLIDNVPALAMNR